MHYFLRITLIALITLFATCTNSANATTHKLVRSAETILQFFPVINGTKISMRLTDFDADINYLPDQLEHSSIKVMVRLHPQSIKALGQKVDGQIIKDDWLQIDNHPTATLAAKDFEQLGPNLYRAYGYMTLVGQRQPIEFYVTINERKADNQLIADATLGIDRTRFGIGTHQKTGNIIVDNIVPVHGHFVMTPILVE